MTGLDYRDGAYRSAPRRPSLLARVFPAPALYAPFLWIVLRASSRAKRGRYGDAEWMDSSLGCIRALERVGVRFEITGTGNLGQGPCVVVANHMSALETVALPAILLPFGRVTFIVKQSLLTYPVFGHIMRSRDPIGVTRTQPREDLKAVFEGGPERLARGISIIVFPQTTRTHVFDPPQFTSIGAKLAQRAGVPLVPLALKTDAWGNGRYLKDFGPVDPSRAVRFAFGERIPVQTRGSGEHQQVVAYISGKLEEWGREERRAAAAGADASGQAGSPQPEAGDG
ncbi:MAG: lysophospholipid acyltransferase family protein [Candidatus Latescibacterota bacterium]